MVFVVDAAVDVVDAVPGDGACATAAGLCTLRAAVQEANASPGAHTIVLQDGVEYVIALPPIDENGLTPDAAGDLDLLDDVTIAGADQATTSIRVAAALGDRAFEVHAGSIAEISDLAIRDGSQLGDAGFIGDGLGGGVLLSGGDLTLRRVTVEDNVADSGGGVAVNWGFFLTVVDSDIRNNEARDRSGGGIYSPSINTTLVVAGSRITDNRTTGDPIYGGGGIWVSVGTISDSLIANNETAGAGGGIAGKESVSLEGVTLRDNTADRGGGAWVAGTESHLSVTSSSVINNVAVAHGGDSRSSTVRSPIPLSPATQCWAKPVSRSRSIPGGEWCPLVMWPSFTRRCWGTRRHTRESPWM